MISTKGRYAIRLMIDLAENREGSVVPLEEAAQHQGISKKYLESIAKLLVNKNLIKGTSGKGGGYRLLRKPCEYTVGEILEAAGETIATVACLNEGAGVCPREKECKTLPMWKKYDSMVRGFFYGITIEDLVNGNI